MLRPRRSHGMMTVRRDGIRWNVKPAPDHILAVGDIHGDLAPKITLNFEVRLDPGSELGNFLFGQLVHPGIRADSSGSQYFLG